jgi:hypothetical protein
MIVIAIGILFGPFVPPSSSPQLTWSSPALSHPGLLSAGDALYPAPAIAIIGSRAEELAAPCLVSEQGVDLDIAEILY